MIITRPKGTNDFLPEETYIWHEVEQAIQKTFDKYGYGEFRTPVFEYTELFVRGIGETTDIVEKEMYTFNDKAGRSLTLRPEGTAPIVRAFLEHKLYQTGQEFKYYYLGPMFRYENPQAGRFRQFHQYGAECLGSKNSMADAEIIALAYDIITSVGLTGLKIKLNTVGCPGCRPVYRRTLTEYFQARASQFCTHCQGRLQKNPLRLLDCKEEKCKALTRDFPSITGYLCHECGDHFEKVRSRLQGLGIEYILDPRLVRGLDYYTNTVFEVIYEGLGAQDAVCGGGRYDGLIQECGGPPIPGVGFAGGMERLIATLLKQNGRPPRQTSDKIFLVFTGEAAQEAVFYLAAGLRSKGYAAEFCLTPRSMKAQFKQADKSGGNTVLILGDDELAAGKIKVKDMKTGGQEDVESSKIYDYLAQRRCRS